MPANRQKVTVICETFGTAVWITDALEYIDLLQDELAACLGFLHVRGWVTPPEKVEQGQRLREALGIKGSGE